MPAPPTNNANQPQVVEEDIKNDRLSSGTSNDDLSKREKGLGDDPSGVPPQNAYNYDENDDTAAGIKRIEGFNEALYNSGKSGKILIIVLVISIGLTMFAYAMDQGLSYQFTAMAASYYLQHVDLGAITTASSIVRSISKPFIGKLADVTSRPAMYTLVLIVYVIGFIVAASCDNLSTYTVGICFTAFGKSGLDLLGDIIVGDLTPLRWRGFFSSLLSTPFIITTFINGEIAEQMIPDQWRWGLGMFCILMPALLSPAIVTLFVIQHKAAKMGMVGMAASAAERKGQKIENKTVGDYTKTLYRGLIEIDILGLLILGFGFAMVLMPFSLYSGAQGGWSNPSMIAMLVVGFVLLIIFTIWEIWFAPHPMMSRNVLVNRAFLSSVVINMFGQMASQCRYVYFSSYVWIITDWSNYGWTVYLSTVTMGLSVVGPFAGLWFAWTQRYKAGAIFGTLVKMLGYAVLLRAGPLSSIDIGSLIVTQLLLCFGAFSVVGARVCAQASVRHQDLASVIANLSLWSSLGSSVGSAIAGAIWGGIMRDNLAKNMPAGTPDSTVTTIYGSIKALRDYDYNDPVRQGAIYAYRETNGVIFAVCLGMALIPCIACWFMPNYWLGDQQNAVTNTGLDGKDVEVPKGPEKPTNGGVWAWIKYYYLL